MSSVIIAGNTSGTVTLSAPDVAGTTTLTLPATTGNIVTDTATQTLTNKTLTGATITVASTAAPAFSAYKNTNQSITSSTFTKITFQAEDYDTNNNFASSTFTPTVAGYYLIGAGFNPNAGGPPSRAILDIYKNGSQVKRLYDVTAKTDNVSGSCLLYLNGTTDYIEVYGYIIATGPIIYGVAADTWFTGAMIRSS